MEGIGEGRGNRMSGKRLALITGLFLVLSAVMGARLLYLQVFRHRVLFEMARKQQERTVQIQPVRGEIFDRHNRPLAQNRGAISFYAIPQKIKHPEAAARRLAVVTGLPWQRLAERFRSKKEFVWIKRKVSDTAARQIRDLRLSGIQEVTETVRYYPEGRIACHVLGFVGIDNQGLAGIELALDPFIQGKPGWIRISQDARGSRLPNTARVHQAAEMGKQVVLTLDNVIQHMAEHQLEETIRKTQAKRGSIIVMDPRNGEVLAMANSPWFDPNAFQEYSLAARRNLAVQDMYEPGSTFKIVTAAAALEEGLIKEDDIIDCENGRGVFGGRVVRDHEPRGRLSFQDVLVFSSNVGMVKVGLKVGAAKIAHYIQKFGFGRPTGIELPGEAVGLLEDSRNWKIWHLASIPFGQGLAVTSLQTAAAYAVIANGGYRVRPTLVKAIRTPEGKTIRQNRTKPREWVLSKEKCAQLRAILAQVVSRGTGREAGIPFFEVAGKTGTAQRPAGEGRGYDPYFHIASFVGFFSVEKPELLILVMLDSPNGVQWGGTLAGPVFRELGKTLATYLGIRPQTGRIRALATQPASGEKARQGIPKLEGRLLSEAEITLRTTAWKYKVVGSGKRVVRQRPAPGMELPAGQMVVLYAANEAALETRMSETVVVPDVVGQPLRQAIDVLQACGLQVAVSGSGRVHRQSLPAFSLVKAGKVCAIHCQEVYRPR